MAPISSSHSFQKLKLDTKAPPKPVASTFDSIPRHESRHDSQQHSARPALSESPARKFDAVEGQLYSSGRPRRSNHDCSQYHALPYETGAAVFSDDDLEASFHKRTTSISFDKEVTLDSGNRLSTEKPLPKLAPLSDSPLDVSEGEESDHSYVEIAYDRRRRSHHRFGEQKHPLLQTTVDELANDSDFGNQDQVASLTSEATISPVLDEIQTPVDPPPSDNLLTPLSACASSPIEFPVFSRRQVPTRTRSFRAELDGDGSLRRASRRSSARSGRSLSSMSPAASFLARYKTTDGPLKPTEPDDEGQGIGYHGEFIIGKQIGFGGFSVVKEVTTIENGKSVVHAAKIVRKQLNDKSEFENEQIQTQFDHEVEIWRFLRHPYILPLMRVYNTEFATFCITRLNKGGTLFDLVRDTRRKKKQGIDGALAKRYTYQLASAIRYLHNDVMIVHRDIKLENCLIDMTVPNAERDGGDVLLCDFGMADFIVSDQRDGPDPQSMGVNQNIGPAETSTSVAGSLQYAAPELFNASMPVFSPAADIWAFGVVIYALLTARLPFDEGFDAKTTMKIQRGEWDVELLFDSDAAQQEGFEGAVELVQGCLDMDPNTRWTISDVLSCAWLNDCSAKLENVSRPWLASF